jgi:hypothetical protein
MHEIHSVMTNNIQNLLYGNMVKFSCQSSKQKPHNQKLSLLFLLKFFHNNIWMRWFDVIFWLFDKNTMVKCRYEIIPQTYCYLL